MMSGPVSPEEFKSAFRTHPGGVALITALGDAGPVALTATSVASVNVDPPLLMFSVTTVSSATAVIVKSDTVVVHLLDVDDIPLAVLGGMMDFTSGMADANAIIAIVKAMEEAFEA